MNPTPVNSTLLLDADNPLGMELTRQLRQNGHEVIAHARHRNHHYSVDLVSESASTEFESLLKRGRNFDRIVFFPRSEPERLDAFEDIARIQEAIDGSLAELKSAAQALIRCEESQIWIILPEESMQYYLPQPARPIHSRAMIAAAKSLAKEIFPFGVKLNVLQIQPYFEQFDAATWKASKEKLKAYALKFRPPQCADIARLAKSLLTTPALPMSGLVIPVGIGYPEMNV